MHGQETEEESLLRGFVRSAEDGRPLQGANVVLRDTSGALQYAVATDGDGFYQISDVAPGLYDLRISYVGHQAREDTLHLAPSTQRTLSVSLPASPERLDEVTVEGQQPVQEAEVGLRRISSADIESIPTPGPGSDLSGYLRSLPGVTTLGDRGGRLYVRGGSPSQNLVLVDGSPIYKPFHIIGHYSAFPSELVSSSDFYAGGFGAKYSGRISSVLDVQLRPGNTQQFEGSLGAGPFLASARFEGPLVEGKQSFLFHGRHSLIEHTGPSLLGQDTPYKFYDVTAKVNTQGESSQCSLIGMRTYDRGSIAPDVAASVRWDNTVVGGQCLLFGGESAQTLDVNFGTTHFNNTIHSRDGATRSAGTWQVHTSLNLTQPISWGGTVSWGVHMQADQYDLDLEEPFLQFQSEGQFLMKGALHLGAEWEWNDAFLLNPSVAAQVPMSWGELSIEPRLRASYRPGGSENTKFTTGGGYYSQFISGISDERDAGSSFQVWTPTPFENHPLRAIHGLLGWNQRLLPSLHLSLEGWYKQLQNLPVPEWTPIARFNTNLVRADGTAFGADFSAQYERDPLRLNVTYGYGQITYRGARSTLSGWVDEPVLEYTPPHDLRHKVGLTASVDLNLFTAGVRWEYSSGLPMTKVYGFDTMLEIRGLRDLPFQDIGTPRALYNRPYSSRLPAYHRLDVSLERQFDLSPTLGLSTEAGAINAYDRANVFYVDIYTLDRVDQLPVLPYLTLQLTFN